MIKLVPEGSVVPFFQRIVLYIMLSHPGFLFYVCILTFRGPILALSFDDEFAEKSKRLAEDVLQHAPILPAQIVRNSMQNPFWWGQRQACGPYWRKLRIIRSVKADSSAEKRPERTENASCWRPKRIPIRSKIDWENDEKIHIFLRLLGHTFVPPRVHFGRRRDHFLDANMKSKSLST